MLDERLEEAWKSTKRHYTQYWFIYSLKNHHFCIEKGVDLCDALCMGILEYIQNVPTKVRIVVTLSLMKIYKDPISTNAKYKRLKDIDHKLRYSKKHIKPVSLLISKYTAERCKMQSIDDTQFKSPIENEYNITRREVYLCIIVLYEIYIFNLNKMSIRDIIYYEYKINYLLDQLPVQYTDIDDLITCNKIYVQTLLLTRELRERIKFDFTSY